MVALAVMLMQVLRQVQHTLSRSHAKLSPARRAAVSDGANGRRNEKRRRSVPLAWCYYIRPLLMFCHVVPAGATSHLVSSSHSSVLLNI